MLATEKLFKRVIRCLDLESISDAALPGSVTDGSQTAWQGVVLDPINVIRMV